MTYRVALTVLLSTIFVIASTASAKSPYQQTTQTQNDRTQVAEAADSEGKRLHALGTIDALRNALEKFEKALPLWRSLGNRGAEAETLGHIATIHGLLGDREKAIDLFHQQLATWESIPDRQKEAAESLTNLGIVYGMVGQQQKAVDSFRSAVSLRRQAGDRLGLARTLDQFGLFHLRAGDLQKAFEYCNEAVTIFRELHDRPGLANSLNNIGGIHLMRGDYRNAREYFVEALELRRALGQRREESIGLNNIARVHDLQGEAQKALDYYRESLAIRRVLGDTAMEAVSINNIGLVYDWLGEKQKALEYYKQALDLFRGMNDRDGQSRVLINIGASYLNALNDPKTALDYFQQALKIAREIGQPIQEAAVLDHIGLAHRKLGDLPKALEHHRKALETMRALGHPLYEAATLNQIGATYFFMGEMQTALDYFNQALRMHRTMGNRGPEAATLYGMARVERDRGNLNEALLSMEASLKIIESLRGSVSSQELRASFLAERHDYFEFYTDLLMRLHQREPTKGHDIAALYSSERARARSLLELLAEARIDLQQGIAPELRQRERDTHSRITANQRRLIDAYSQPQPDQNRIAELESELKKLDTEREQLNMEIRQKHPRYAAVEYPAPPDLKQIQSLLDDDTLLLEYSLGKDSSFLFAVTRNDFIAVPLPSSATIVGQVQALRETLSKRPQRSLFASQIEISRSLYRQLIEPAGRLLTGKRKLTIVPSGILHYLSFEALLSSGDAKSLATTGLDRWPYLLRSFAVSYAPSAGVLASLQSRTKVTSDRQKNFLAFADPAYVNRNPAEVRPGGALDRGALGNQQSWNIGPLPESRREVEQIARIYPTDKVSLLLGEQASEENVKTPGRFSDYRFIHFATHGLLNEERPPYSGLILSLKPTVSSLSVSSGSTRNSSTPTEDGLLQVYEIFDLKLNAELVVLSACETGLGKQVKGEGLVGLTHAFFYAGTSSVLVSLWKVQDRSTADLMVNFYQELDAGKNKAESLRQAKLRMIQQNRYAHPYYWAPFVLMGNPR